jgi:hypothetical protein
MAINEDELTVGNASYNDLVEHSREIVRIADELRDIERGELGDRRSTLRELRAVADDLGDLAHEIKDRCDEAIEALELDDEAAREGLRRRS